MDWFVRMRTWYGEGEVGRYEIKGGYSRGDWNGINGAQAADRDGGRGEGKGKKWLV